MIRLFIKHSFKKVFTAPFLSIFQIIVLSLVTTIFLVTISFKTVVYQSLLKTNQDVYKDIDFVIDLENTLDRRFFTIEELTKYQDQFEYMIGSFAIPLQDQEGENVVAYFVDYNEFSYLMNGYVHEVSEQRVIVSSDYSKQSYNFTTIGFSENMYQLQIIDTFDKSGVLSNVNVPVIIIDKSQLQLFFPITNIPHFFNNIYNQVYVKFKGDSNGEILKEIKTEFTDANIREVNNEELIKQNANNYSTTTNIVGLFTLIPLAISLLVLIDMAFKNNFKNHRNFIEMGAGRKFSFFFFFGEFFIYIIIGFTLGIFLAQTVLGWLMKVITSQTLLFRPRPNLYAFVLLCFFTILIYYITYLRLTRNKDYPNMVQFNPTYIKGIFGLIITIVGIVLYFSSIYLFKGFLYLLLGIVGSISIFIILQYLTMHLLKKNPFFIKISFHHLLFSKIKFLIILLISFASITVAYSFHGMRILAATKSNINKHFLFDYAALGITNHHQQHLELLDKYNNINYEKVNLYSSVLVENYSFTLPYVFIIEKDSNSDEKYKRNTGIYLSRFYKLNYNLEDNQDLNLILTSNNTYCDAITILDNEYHIPFAYVVVEKELASMNNSFNTLLISVDNSIDITEINNQFIKNMVIMQPIESLLENFNNNLAQQKSINVILLVLTSSSFLLCIIFLTRLFYENKHVDFHVLSLVGNYNNFTNISLNVIVLFIFLVCISSLGYLLFGSSIYNFIRFNYGYFTLINRLPSYIYMVGMLFIISIILIFIKEQKTLKLIDNI